MSVYYMGLFTRIPVFVVSDKASFKPVSLATETSWKIKISSVTSLHMILYNKQIKKAMISLLGCAGWSALLLFANTEDRFSPVEAHIVLLLPLSSVDDPIGFMQFRCESEVIHRTSG